jgi:hypothetical protein
MSLLNTTPVNSTGSTSLSLEQLQAIPGDMTPLSIAQSARYPMNDRKAPYRNSDDELVSYVNDGLREAVVIRPELFSTIDVHGCTAGTVEQRMAFPRAVTILEVLSVDTGGALKAFDMDMMNAFHPGWRSAPPGPAREWSRFANDPLAFFISPPAPTGQGVRVRFIRNPKMYGPDELIFDLPVIYRPALIAYVVYRAESKDSEHVLSQRAQMTYSQFVALIKG